MKTQRSQKKKKVIKTKMAQMLESSDKDFKSATIKMN